MLLVLLDIEADKLELESWCGWRGSNPRPLASEANTLSTELQPQMIILSWIRLWHANLKSRQSHRNALAHWL